MSKVRSRISRRRIRLTTRCSPSRDPRSCNSRSSVSTTAWRRLFLSEFLRRQLTQFLIDQEQELLGGVGIAHLDGGQDAGHLTHRRLTVGEKQGIVYCLPG